MIKNDTCKMSVFSTSILSTSIFLLQFYQKHEHCYVAPDNKQGEIDFCQYLMKHSQPLPWIQSKLFPEDISFNAMRINTNCKASENLTDIFTNCIRFLRNARIFLTAVRFVTLFSSFP